ncbi:Germinal-center associated nuclear protein [Porphyridium purpureum]|uniref:Germinal-center associated nuclear protein n=1 Tax=Porphyridium purpureum TaxID=35688 RepID=A0A5J4Z7I1_PORPP|nr:Germinal-center associated nuclear protein [Porphyridium purpureum]|eukprot:POR3751..scf295_1
MERTGDAQTPAAFGFANRNGFGGMQAPTFGFGGAAPAASVAMSAAHAAGSTGTWVTGGGGFGGQTAFGTADAAHVPSSTEMDQNVAASHSHAQFPASSAHQIQGGGGQAQAKASSATAWFGAAAPPPSHPQQHGAGPGNLEYDFRTGGSPSHDASRVRAAFDLQPAQQYSASRTFTPYAVPASARPDSRQASTHNAGEMMSDGTTQAPLPSSHDTLTFGKLPDGSQPAHAQVRPFSDTLRMSVKPPQVLNRNELASFFMNQIQLSPESITVLSRGTSAVVKFSDPRTAKEALKRSRAATTGLDMRISFQKAPEPSGSESDGKAPRARPEHDASGPEKAPSSSRLALSHARARTTWINPALLSPAQALTTGDAVADAPFNQPGAGEWSESEPGHDAGDDEDDDDAEFRDSDGSDTKIDEGGDEGEEHIEGEGFDSRRSPLSSRAQRFEKGSRKETSRGASGAAVTTEWRVVGEKQDLEQSECLVGTCLDMCPAKERIDRQEQRDLSIFEILPGTGANGEASLVDHAHAVKKYARSAAASEAARPEQIRPPQVLVRTMDYLIDEILDKGERNFAGATFVDVHNFVRDRTRSIRQDFTYQGIRSMDCVRVHEEAVRFHILSEFELRAEDPSVFSSAQNMEQLKKCLTSLREMYGELRRTQDQHAISGLHEGEMTAYQVVLTGDLQGLLRMLDAEVLASPLITLAVRALVAEKQKDFWTFFHVLRMSPYLMACLLYKMLDGMRHTALMCLAKASRSTKDSMTLGELVRLLDLASVDDGIQFLEHYGLEAVSDERDEDLAIDALVINFRPDPPVDLLQYLPWSSIGKGEPLIEAKARLIGSRAQITRGAACSSADAPPGIDIPRTVPLTKKPASELQPSGDSGLSGEMKPKVDASKRLDAFRKRLMQQKKVSDAGIAMVSEAEMSSPAQEQAAEEHCTSRSKVPGSTGQVSSAEQGTASDAVATAPEQRIGIFGSAQKPPKGPIPDQTKGSNVSAKSTTATPSAALGRAATTVPPPPFPRLLPSSGGSPRDMAVLAGASVKQNVRAPVSTSTTEPRMLSKSALETGIGLIARPSVDEEDPIRARAILPAESGAVSAPADKMFGTNKVNLRPNPPVPVNAQIQEGHAREELAKKQQEMRDTQVLKQIERRALAEQRQRLLEQEERERLEHEKQVQRQRVRHVERVHSILDRLREDLTELEVHIVDGAMGRFDALALPLFRTSLVSSQTQSQLQNVHFLQNEANAMAELETILYESETWTKRLESTSIAADEIIQSVVVDDGKGSGRNSNTEAVWDLYTALRSKVQLLVDKIAEFMSEVFHQYETLQRKRERKRAVLAAMTRPSLAGHTPTNLCHRYRSPNGLHSVSPNSRQRLEAFVRCRRDMFARLLSEEQAKCGIPRFKLVMVAWQESDRSAAHVAEWIRCVFEIAPRDCNGSAEQSAERTQVLLLPDDFELENARKRAAKRKRTCVRSTGETSVVAHFLADSGEVAPVLANESGVFVLLATVEVVLEGQAGFALSQRSHVLLESMALSMHRRECGATGLAVVCAVAGDAPDLEKGDEHFRKMIQAIVGPHVLLLHVAQISLVNRLTERPPDRCRLSDGASAPETTPKTETMFVPDWLPDCAARCISATLQATLRHSAFPRTRLVSLSDALGEQMYDSLERFCEALPDYGRLVMLDAPSCGIMGSTGALAWHDAACAWREGAQSSVNELRFHRDACALEFLASRAILDRAVFAAEQMHSVILSAVEQSVHFDNIPRSQPASITFLDLAGVPSSVRALARSCTQWAEISLLQYVSSISGALSIFLSCHLQRIGVDEDLRVEVIEVDVTPQIARRARIGVQTMSRCLPGVIATDNRTLVSVESMEMDDDAANQM